MSAISFRDRVRRVRTRVRTDLYLGDCREILKTLNVSHVKAVVTDPPYGISLRTDYKEQGRGELAECNNFSPVFGDDQPFDPSHLLRFPVVVLFGANWYADRLPVSGGWVVWDKVRGLVGSDRDFGFNYNSDCELIWTNVGNSVRIIYHRWAGMLKDSEKDQRRIHPTQKPIALMRQLIEHYTDEWDTVLDPYMGSGPVGIACVECNRDYIGIEIEEHYFSCAKERIEAARRK